MAKIHSRHNCAQEEGCKFASISRWVGLCAAMCPLDDCQQEELDDMHHLWRAKMPNARKGVSEGSDMTGIVYRHCGLNVCKNARKKENMSVARAVWPNSVRQKARKTDVSAAGVWIVRETARCDARSQENPIFREKNIICNEREAQWRRCVNIETLNLTSDRTWQGKLYQWRRRNKRIG